MPHHANKNMNTEHQYTIIIDSDKDIVEGRVLEKLQEGWQCVGGVSVYLQEWERDGYRESCNTYAQAMVRTRQTISVKVAVDTSDALTQLKAIQETARGG